MPEWKSSMGTPRISIRIFRAAVRSQSGAKQPDPGSPSLTGGKCKRQDKAAMRKIQHKLRPKNQGLAVDDANG